MTEPQESLPAQPQRPKRQRSGRAWTMAAAVIVALIVLAAAAVIFATRDRSKTPAVAAPSVSPSALQSSSAAVNSPPPALDQTVPVSAPRGVIWTLFQSVALPTSRTAGPTRVDGPVHAGYAHTPTGALLAAKQIGVRYLITPANGWRRVVEEQVVPGPGKQAFVAARTKVTTDNVPAGTYGQSAGFRFVTYNPDIAVIQFATRFSGGTLQITTSTTRWLDGDWRLQLQADGSVSPTAQRVDNLAGFVPWSGL